MRLAEPQGNGAHEGASALAVWQQNLLAALWAPDMAEALRRLGPTSGATGTYQRRGMAAYRSHASLQSARALAVVYPAIASVLGDENFQGLARSLWRAHPPQRGDLGQWGGEMAAHIARLDDLSQAEPYLADLARLEWALHRAELAADDDAEPASFALLVDEDPDDLGLTLAPGAGSFHSPWPVASLLQAHRDGRSALDTPSDQAIPEAAIYWRQGWRAVFRAAQAGEARFLDALLAGQTLAAALAGAHDFDLGGWLTPAVQEGLLLKVVRVSKPQG